LTRVIIFSRTKHGADRVVKNLTIDGHDAAAIHGNKSQNARQAALKGFSSGRVRILVATDIAARGIDVPDISHVINYGLPDDAENYVHRIGRTARNGASGHAITLCDGTERSKLRDVERLIRRTLPVTGDLHLANETGVKAAPKTAGGRGEGNSAPRRGELAGFTDGQRQRNNDPREASAADGQRKPGQRPHANAGRHFSGAKKAAIMQDRAPRNHVGAPKMDHEQKPAGSRPAKQRWNKGQKDAGRARRVQDSRPREIA
jgi:ATP-dependent RNA helicase RhlE